jgi:hypothetical protein
VKKNHSANKVLDRKPAMKRRMTVDDEMQQVSENSSQGRVKAEWIITLAA